ncbi:MAG: ABC transporter ATP-binding protein [Gemmatimonadetes bacterium]|nr:ABC transporter ATP-binding protein [Gemmatimonadota bacterium]
MAEPLVRLRGVDKAYVDHVVTPVLHGIDLTVLPGEFIALTGPSGSGKSTLLNLIGLLDRPTAGEVYLEGRATSALNDAELTRLRARRLGFVFQFHHLLPAFTAVENVELPMLADRGRRDPELRARAARLLESIGLGDRMPYLAPDLSGGQQPRVAIARAHAGDPPQVLADEPTGNLDTESGRQVLELVRRINRERHTAFIIVTHDERIAHQCDRIVHLVDGRIVGDDAP